MYIRNSHHITLSVKKNILWLQVAIDDAVRVKLLNSESYFGKTETSTEHSLTQPMGPYIFIIMPKQRNHKKLNHKNAQSKKIIAQAQL